MAQIFLSYRRDDSADAAGRIHDRLVARYGAERIFMDVDTIPPGVDFRLVIDEAVGRCHLFLVVIGPGWLDSLDRHGQVRLQNPADFVRLEIEAALKRGIPVIPVLVGGADIPGGERLPESLHPLIFRNGLMVRRNPDFHHDVDRLISWMEKLLGPEKPVESKRKPRKPRASKRAQAEALHTDGDKFYYGLGVDKDDVAAFKAYCAAAELGHAGAQFSVGWLYRNGWGVATDLAEAVHWYRRAADQNHADALRNMGLAYQYGWGVSVDAAKAIEFFRKAAGHNLPAAQNNLGVLFEKGEGIERDLRQALDWYRMAAANGHKKANEAVRRVTALLSLAPTDQGTAE